MRAEKVAFELEFESVEALLATVREPPRYVSDLCTSGPTALEEAESLMTEFFKTVERYPSLFCQGRALPAIRVFERGVNRMGVLLTQLGTSEYKMLQKVRTIAPRTPWIAL